MLPRRYILNKISKLRQELREEIQLLFSMYAKKNKPIFGKSEHRIVFFNNIIEATEFGFIDPIKVQDNEIIIIPIGSDLDPIKLSKVMSIDDLMTIYAIALELEGIKK
ncbi:MAG: hypothetical protein PHT69_02250 [Bacteroidales bacterium]|nr:hypothetical protein [Bacteroidales bacterium]